MDKEITDLIIFYCIYLLGVIIYFSHFSLLACKGISKLRALRHLSEDEELEVFERYFPKVLFQTVIMGEFPVLFSVYIMVNENISNNIFISSGLFTVVWLLIAGIIIKRSYRLVIYKIKEKLGYDFDRSFCNKEVFWVMCTLLYGILFGLYDWKIFLIILSIVLGKYIWMDSIQVVSVLDVKKKVIKLFETTRIEFLLLGCQASIMGYLILSWYPIRGQKDISDNMIIALMIEAFCLMPILDLLVWKSMNLCAETIINNRDKVNNE